MTDKDKNRLLKSLPSVDEVLKSPEVEKWLRLHARRFVLQAVREHLETLRKEILTGKVKKPDFSASGIAPGIEALIARLTARSLRPVINATGIVLHTNLGRAPLPDSSLRNIVEVSKGYSNLEYDIEEGRRGKRHSHARRLLREITGAEDATVVNNNAGAVLIALSALAKGKEVIVSRGELVEIGGSFRIPEVMAQSGAILKEVGATNKTHPRDYESAIGPDTALILKVHKSNYRMVGFTDEVAVEQLSALGKRHGIPVMNDLGSGCLVDLRAHGVGAEPVVREEVLAGADIVTFSGDKLLGGPQAGIIVGKTDIIEKINRNPLARALRIDKMTLAALEAILFEYADPDRAVRNIPTLRMLLEKPESIKARAERLAAGLKKHLKKARIEVVEECSEAGGGSLPGVSLLSYAVSIRPAGVGVNAVEEKLRKGTPPVIARIKEDSLLFDARTIGEDEIPVLISRIAESAA
jgi:L-seryl-tRNA(Ser) seleniumtransferase